MINVMDFKDIYCDYTSLYVSFLKQFLVKVCYSTRTTESKISFSDTVSSPPLFSIYI